MRVSIEKDDPGYATYGKLVADSINVKIILDGIEQGACLTADSSEGWIKRLVMSDGGRPAQVNGEFINEVVRGAVEIITEPPSIRR